METTWREQRLTGAARLRHAPMPPAVPYPCSARPVQQRGGRPLSPATPAPRLCLRKRRALWFPSELGEVAGAACRESRLPRTGGPREYKGRGSPAGTRALMVTPGVRVFFCPSPPLPTHMARATRAQSCYQDVVIARYQAREAGPARSALATGLGRGGSRPADSSCVRGRRGGRRVISVREPATMRFKRLRVDRTLVDRIRIARTRCPRIAAPVSPDSQAPHRSTDDMSVGPLLRGDTSPPGTGSRGGPGERLRRAEGGRRPTVAQGISDVTESRKVGAAELVTVGIDVGDRYSHPLRPRWRRGDPAGGASPHHDRGAHAGARRG